MTLSTVISLNGFLSRNDRAAANIARSASSGLRRRRAGRPTVISPLPPSGPIYYLIDTMSIDTASIDSKIWYSGTLRGDVMVTPWVARRGGQDTGVVHHGSRWRVKGRLDECGEPATNGRQRASCRRLARA